MVILKSSWSFWYHDIKTEDWSKESYVFIHKVESAEEIWGVLRLLTPKHMKVGMYFIMKNDIFPEWSNEENKRGGYWSLKLPDTRNDEFHKWVMYMISEDLCESDKGIIHGLSYSPKYNHGILKIWNNDSIFGKVNYLNSHLNTNGCKYTAFKRK